MKTSFLILIFSGLVSLKQCSIKEDLSLLPSLEKNNLIESNKNIDNTKNTEKHKKNLLFTPFLSQSHDGENAANYSIINYN